MAEEGQQQLPSEVLETLRLLGRGEELTSALRPSSRAPGSLHWSWAPMSGDRLRRLIGFAPLRLPARFTSGHREVLAVPGRAGEPRLDVDQDGQAVTSSFAAFYLPQHLDWRQARTSSVLRTDVTAIHVREADDRPWPLSTIRRRHTVDADGVPIPLGVGGDCAVVEVGGTAVGVQVDLSGAVSVGWSLLPTGQEGRRWNVTMLTRRSAVDAVQLVQDANLLISSSSSADCDAPEVG